MADATAARTEVLLRRLVRRGTAVALNKVLPRTRPEDVAAAMEAMTSAEQRRLHGMIADRDYAADVLSHLSEGAARDVTAALPTEAVRDLVDRMAADDATDFLGALSAPLRDELLEEMEDDPTAEGVRELLTWPSDSAGGLMNPAVFQMPHTATAGDAIGALQARHEDLETIYYLYVVDAQQRLLGVTSLRSLLTTAPSTRLVDLMARQVVTVSPRTDQEEVARMVARYDLFAIPVVDDNRHVLGVVTVDDVVDVIREEAHEDMMLMAGVSDDAPEEGGVLRHVRTRGPWLFATLFSGVLAAELIDRFGAGFPRAAVILGFVPMVMGIGGNVGIQSATIAVRSLATGRLAFGGGLPFLWREFRVALALGLSFALMLGLWGEWRFAEIGLAVGCSVVVAMTLAGLVGGSIPLLLARLGVDPAVATGPFVTATLDLLGILVYFGTCRILVDG